MGNDPSIIDVNCNRKVAKDVTFALIYDSVEPQKRSNSHGKETFVRKLWNLKAFALPCKRSNLFVVKLVK